MSQQLLAPLLSEAAKAGITEQLVLFNPHEYSTLTMWSEYINRMLRDIDARSKDSPLLLVGFSSGTAPAFAVAHRLGKRVLQVCVVGMRPVFNAALGEGTTEPVRRFWEALRGLHGVGDVFTAPALASKLGRERQRVNELLRPLRSLDVVELIEEAKGPHPAEWRVKRPTLPDGCNVLPEPEALR